MPPRVDRWTSILCNSRAQYYKDLGAFYRLHLSSNPISKPKRPHADNNHYGHEQVRSTLREMFGPKCAYCEGDVSALSPQHVEHYRPASRYPALAYEWENLLLACPHCNSTYKSDHFPVSPTGNTPREFHRTPCARTGSGELPLLLNPCQDNPEIHLSFKDGFVIALSDPGRRTRRICRLNRDELVKSRRRHLTLIRFAIEKYLLAKIELNTTETVRIAEILRDASDNYAPYAGMVRTELLSEGINWMTL